MPTLTEEQYLDIVEREERALLGDAYAVTIIINLDMPRLLAYIRELQQGQAGELQW